MLDWTDSSHYSNEARPCRHCGSPTHLRDERGKPADKACAEAAYAEVIRVAMAQHQQGRL